MAEGISDGTDKYPMGTGGLFTPDVLNHCDLRTFDEVSIFISKHIADWPFIIETGTMYTFDPEVPYWNTTTSLIKRIVEYKPGSQFFSIDQEHFHEVLEKAFASAYIRKSSMIEFLTGDSVEKLKEIDRRYGKLPLVDILCLDSGEDPDLMVREYNAIKHRLKNKHYVLVDDIHNANSVKYLKMVPMLKELGYDWVQVPTHTGLFVAAKGYPVPRK